MFPNPLTSLLGVDLPLIQAPMAGGPTTPELVAAVSDAGGLGSYAAAMLSPEAMAEGVARVRELTSRPFNVNLFVLETPQPTAVELEQAQARLAPYRAALGQEPTVAVPERFCEDNRAQIEALIALAPPVASFTFGVLDETTVSHFHAAGSVVLGTATTVAEALAWEAAGADAVCMQGAEAGGHRGTFLGDFEQSSIGLMALLPQAAAALRVPVIAAGGIMDGRGIAAALMLGAQAAQLGTAFLCCPEAGIHAGWKTAIRTARDDSTRLTRVFSGRYARGVVNAFMDDLRGSEADIPAYPVQNALTGGLRRAAAAQGRTEFMSLWAGQGASLARELPAGELVGVLEGELRAAMR
jgi:nitronate monooxygenase